MLIVIASVFGLLGLGGFILAQTLSSSGVEQRVVDMVHAHAFGLLAIAFMFASPTLTT